MDALMAALVAAIFCLVADRPAWLAAILADRYGAAKTLAGAAIALAAAGALAVAGGLLVAPRITPEAKVERTDAAPADPAGAASAKP